MASNGNVKMAVAVVAIGTTIALAGCSRDPEHVRRASEALELHYINNGPYYPVHCRNREVDGTWFIFCTSGGGDGTIGGLYRLTGSGVAPVNGKAMTHTRGTTMVKSASLQPVQILENDRSDPKQWVDIPKVLETFR